MVSVKTSLGVIRGRAVSVPHADLTGITVHQYLGIPFAVPPVGQLRFADPVPLDRLPSGTLTSHFHFLSSLASVWRDIFIIIISFMGVRDGGWGDTCPPPPKKKNRETFFGQFVCKIRALFGQKSCKFLEFC